MSTPSFSTETGRDLDYTDALLFGAAVMGLMAGLIVLRFSFNLVLDCYVLDDRDGVRRRLENGWRRICPFWRVRTDIEESSNDMIASPSTGRTFPNPESTTMIPGSVIEMADQSQTQQPSFNSAIIDQLLPCKELTSQALEEVVKEMRRGNDVVDSIAENGESSPNAIMCSICLNELLIGSQVYASSCRHVFHAGCILQWVAKGAERSHGIDCPNCRTTLLSRVLLNRILLQPADTNVATTTDTTTDAEEAPTRNISDNPETEDPHNPV